MSARMTVKNLWKMQTERESNLHPFASAFPRALTEFSWKRLAWGKRRKWAPLPQWHLIWSKNLQPEGRIQESLQYSGPKEKSPSSRGKVEQKCCWGRGQTYLPTSHTKTSPSPCYNNQSTATARQETLPPPVPDKGTLMLRMSKGKAIWYWSRRKKLAWAQDPNTKQRSATTRFKNPHRNISKSHPVTYIEKVIHHHQVRFSPRGETGLTLKIPSTSSAV